MSFTKVKRDDYIAGLRALADFLESRPDLPMPTYGETVYVWQKSVENVREVTLMMSPCDKEQNDDNFKLVRKFGPHELKIVWNRDSICERKQVGSRHVAGYWVDAHDEPVYEWDCTKPLLATEHQNELTQGETNE